MKKFVRYLIFFLFGLAILFYIAYKNPVKTDENEIAGFGKGFLHGLVAFIVLFKSLFKRGFEIYQSHNNGFWYNVGFLMGVGFLEHLASLIKKINNFLVALRGYLQSRRDYNSLEGG